MKNKNRIFRYRLILLCFFVITIFYSQSNDSQAACPSSTSQGSCVNLSDGDSLYCVINGTNDDFSYKNVLGWFPKSKVMGGYIRCYVGDSSWKNKNRHITFSSTFQGTTTTHVDITDQNSWNLNLENSIVLIHNPIFAVSPDSPGYYTYTILLTVDGISGSVATFGFYSGTPVSGKCGSSNGKSFLSAPSADLCSAGSSSGLSGSGPWTWSCLGSFGGSTESCGTVGASVTPPPPTCTCPDPSLYCKGVGLIGSCNQSCPAGTKPGCVAPTLNFTASPVDIPNGGSTTLSWNTTNATYCRGYVGGGIGGFYYNPLNNGGWFSGWPSQKSVGPTSFNATNIKFDSSGKITYNMDCFSDVVTGLSVSKSVTVNKECDPATSFSCSYDPPLNDQICDGKSGPVNVEPSCSCTPVCGGSCPDKITLNDCSSRNINCSPKVINCTNTGTKTLPGGYREVAP